MKKIDRSGQTDEMTTQGIGKKKKSKKFFRRTLLGLLIVLVAAGSVIGLGMWTSRYPDKMNMGTNCNMSDMGYMANMCQMGNTSVSSGPVIPIAKLQAPQTAEHVDAFTLTAEPAHLSFGPGHSADAWTFNGTSPGPTLHARQGDLITVHLVNHLSVGVTIHWHGVAVPNSADGVAGVTQDAVKPGQTYTYRFVAKDAGTYWYHSHQESFEETGKGLFGLLVVDPAKPTTHDDVDVALALHSWDVLTFNALAGTLHISARPGQWVRLRLLNTDNYAHLLTLVGAPFMVAALDGHDLNQPTPLTGTSISIDAAQRYDLRFRMPEHGSIALLAANDNGQYQKTPAVMVGQSSDSLASIVVPTAHQKMFDFAFYGQPQQGTVNLQSHFDATYTISLGAMFGFSNGRPGPVFTLDGKSFPDTPTIVVRPGQLIRLRFVNDSPLGGDHPMHIHGHTFIVLAKNGHALTGSPVYQDTVAVGPHETYDVAFYANNPGLWMLHCHNLFHANHGMDMMVVYPNISTPYTIGYASGNFPD
ncbi:MAG TPA: multicopper oxidase family protein [Ktedonobacteraceae bacterium]|nr:multicopper oxidase family protein [Ktedonobacteraceae bacterium]